MPTTLMLAGDVNLMDESNPETPFRQVTDVLGAADLRFANLECCFYEPSGERAMGDEGFWASMAMSRALTIAGFDVVGNANNVNYGGDAIVSSLTELDRIGIPHTGAGRNDVEAQAPAIVTVDGLRIGFIQRTSVFWPVDHEAKPHTPGVAVLPGHTAYEQGFPRNRPGVKPIIHTWADAEYLDRYCADVEALRQQVDVLVASHHWGYRKEPLRYMKQIAHAAVRSGADIVIGHGPHAALPVEIYQGKPIFYGLGCFSFRTAHRGRDFGDWLGMMATVTLNGRDAERVSFRFVRHTDANETYFSPAAREAADIDRITAASAQMSTQVKVDGDEVVVTS